MFIPALSCRYEKCTSSTSIGKGELSMSSSAQGALSSSKGGGYGFAKKEYEQCTTALSSSKGGGYRFSKKWGTTRCLQDYIQTLEKLSKAKFDSIASTIALLIVFCGSSVEDCFPAKVAKWVIRAGLSKWDQIESDMDHKSDIGTANKRRRKERLLFKRFRSLLMWQKQRKWHRYEQRDDKKAKADKVKHTLKKRVEKVKGLVMKKSKEEKEEYHMEFQEDPTLVDTYEVVELTGRPQYMNMEIESTPMLVLDDECLNSKDLSNSLLGRVKEFASLSNLKMVLTNEEVPGWVPDFMEETDEDYDSDDGSKEGGLKVEDVAILEAKAMWKSIEIDSPKIILQLYDNGDKESIAEGLRSLKKRMVIFSRASQEEPKISGLTMRYNMEGCMKNMAEIIESQGVNRRSNVFLICSLLNAGLEEVPSGGSSFTLGFDKLVEDTWIEAPVYESNVMTNMMMKLKYLKQKIREWNKDKGEGNAEVIKQRMDVIKSLQDMENLQSLETAQKAKIKWAIEGDENSRYYHGVELDLEVSIEEIKRRFGIVGLIIKPSPRRMYFFFYRCFWKVIEDDVVDAVTYFFTHGFFPKGSNSSFIALILKVPDANMVKDFRPISLIGSLSSRGSIIVNGSPTEEFQFYKGLKQGDPLSLFLFILIMESLHISFQRVLDAGMFKRITLGPSLQLSHMFYADDAVFVGQWSDANFETIVHVLECFFRASGMRINMSKRKLMGISVEEDKVELATSKIGCLILKPPFSYLVSKVGGLMSRIQSWNEVVDSVTAQLSKWKMKTLSIGGRLTLLKSVLGSMPIYHMSIFKVPMSVLHMLEDYFALFFSGPAMKLNSKKTSWVKWKNVLASKEKGGLGVSSLYALNRGLMFKWVWRFFTQNTSLWAKVIKAIHGDDGKVGKNAKSSFPSIWLDIVHEMELLKKQIWIYIICIKIKQGNGENIDF
ncbi:RNA-directed DNA polymerase, eukaryota, reverse transcriptase zinc-binding domain protein [Tanacetum coccineum]|uniref:RNA-directed DNA polymerase, eukaryota, reverse transcriptase zinc-binding domain protein n=1 Tax=Tanacetum coccineum TaxID=301880 RepID=A0ABQ4ZSB0_9ASTR